MHHYKGKRTAFNYNPDLSGEVLVQHTHGGVTVLDGDDLRDFFLAWLQSRLISKLEDFDIGKWLGR